MTNCRAAELAKLLENTYRLVNIALVNELAQLCADQGIDTWEVIEAAATKPFGFMPFYPGPGVGGHCIPLDPAYLTWQSRRDTGRPFRLVELAKDINDQMPIYTARRIMDALNDRGVAMKGAKVLALGVTYKPDVGDVRESAAIQVLAQLSAWGAKLSFHDPFVSAIDEHGVKLRRRRLTEDAGARCRCGTPAHPPQHLRPRPAHDLVPAAVRRPQRHRPARQAQCGRPVTTAAATPAVLGGTPAFPDRLPLVRPTIDDVPGLTAELGAILEQGLLTNGATVRRLEDAVSARLGVEAVAVSSCTAGLMLVLQALGATGRVVMPSFTFSASAHAVLWAGGSVDFADVEPERATLDPAALGDLLDGAAAITATHIYGSPCDVEALGRLADEAGVPLVFDAAHALGSSRGGRPIGSFGAAEVFSLSPTKVVVAGEGGIVATADTELAATVRMGRDYGNPGDYDTRFPGLNARMSELHAAVALASFSRLDEHIATRVALVDRFEAGAAGVPGLRVIRPADGDTSTFKDLTVVVDADSYGLSAAELQRALDAEGIDSRRYFHPPIHRQRSYQGRWADPRPLPVTDQLASSVLSPPLWSHLEPAVMDRVAATVVELHQRSSEVRGALRQVS